MSRQPALMDPRTAMPPLPPERPARLVPWSFVALGVLLLSVAAVIAWLSVNPPLALLNVRSPGAAGAGGDASKGNGGTAERPVAIAYIDVEKGVTPLYPVRPGRVVEVFVNEGDEVSEGQPLVRTDDELAKQQLVEAELALEGAKVGKEKAEQVVVQHKGMIESQEALIGVREKTVAKAEAGVEKARHFFNERLGGSKQDITIQRRELEEAQAAVDAEKKKLTAMKAADPTAAVRAAAVDIKAKQQQIEKAKTEVTRYVLRAPAKGKILRSWVTLGETLGMNPQRPAMEFCPEGERIVRAEVEQEYAGRWQKGMKAKIQDFDGGVEGTWDGEVTRVSDWITKRRSQVFEPMQFNDVRTLEAIIRFKGDKPSLRIGQRVRVTLEP